MTRHPPPAQPAPDIDSIYRRIGWRLIPLLMLGYVAAYIDRSNVGFAKLQFIAELHLTETMYGIGAGLFYLGYCLFEVPSNLMLARIGARRTFLRIMVLWGLCSAALAGISEASHFYVLRFLLGAAEAGFFPGVLFYLSQWAPASRRARFTALFMSAMALSGIVGGPLAGLIMHSMDGLAGLKGWQWLFIVEGAPACVLGLICYWLLADRPADAHWLTQEEKRIVEAELRQESVQGTHRQSDFIGALRDKRLYVLATMSIALISGIGGISLWLPTIMRSAGVTDVLHIGALSAVPYVFAVVVQQLVARSSDRNGERRWHAGIPAALAALAWFALPLVQDQAWLALAMLTVITAGSFGATGPFWSMPASYLTGAAAAGGIAIVTTCGSAFAFLSPIFVGWTVTTSGSLAIGYIYYGALMALGASVLIYGTRVRKPDTEAPRVPEPNA